MLAGLLAGGPALAQGAESATPDGAGDTPMPYYSASQVLGSLYGRHLPGRAAAFAQAAQTQEQALVRFCAGGHAGAGQAAEALRGPWRQALDAWLQLSTPSLGPLVVRRSLRQIDFTPIRPQLIERALQKAPQTPADMELVGTPAKGFGALDWLLAQGLQPATPACAFAAQVARAITAEASALQADLSATPAKAWDNPGTGEEGEADPDQAARAAQATSEAMAEWVNQWLGALERLRWAQMDKPIQAAEGSGKPPALARQRLADNLADWQMQWQALKAQAVLTPAQRRTPPVPGQSLIPIEALLLSKGHIALAARWRQRVEAADAALHRLQSAGAPDSRSTGRKANQAARPSANPAANQMGWTPPLQREVVAAAARLKVVTALYQAEVAPALDIPLGFSDADGD
ncbi:hypothetical protein CCO03_10195 [Comamonas serinivorans]|uniref:Imelysin-like domain-containing protein n=1 Tax=Comamonas serinivorans TaxID=1082851 RepID=A0A1Y0EMX2_9BURK|nr:hypothetical protein [Comamonas serinivorans]ARU05005.1 hypothetical protein CCO03_10195 [Comamonas serinivorans]